MTVDELLSGEWKVLVEETPADLAMVISFSDGQVIMHGAAVGSYAVEGKVITATIGEDVLLRISLPDLSPVLPGIPVPEINVLQAAMATEIPGDDEGSIAEYASLVRQRYDVVPEEEVRRRVAR